MGFYCILEDPRQQIHDSASTECYVHVKQYSRRTRKTHKCMINLDRERYVHVKISKISPGAFIFQRPFLRGLFMEGLIFGGAYLWREICVSKSIGLAL